MMELILAAALLSAPDPRFSDSELQRLTACADGEAFAACSGLEAETLIAQACMAQNSHADIAALKQCFFEPLMACIDAGVAAGVQAVSTPESIVLICGARLRGGVQIALDQWMIEHETPRAEAALRDVRALLAEVRLQANEQATASLERGETVSKASGYRLGVWVDFALFAHSRLRDPD